MMKATFVILADPFTQNLARRAVLDLHHNNQVEFYASLLPAHVSLKQPFEFDSLERLEAYFDALAASIAPFPITLDRYYTASWPGYGILGLNVVETHTLRSLHNRLNAELSQLFANPVADHDGEGYRFHLTFEMGPVEKANPFQAYYDRLENKQVNITFQAEQIALFYYQDLRPGSFITYKVLPLTGQS